MIRINVLIFIFCYFCGHAYAQVNVGGITLDSLSYRSTNDGYLTIQIFMSNTEGWGGNVVARKVSGMYHSDSMNDSGIEYTVDRRGDVLSLSLETSDTLNVINIGFGFVGGGFESFNLYFGLVDDIYYAGLNLQDALRNHYNEVVVSHGLNMDTYIAGSNYIGDNLLWRKNNSFNFVVTTNYIMYIDSKEFNCVAAPLFYVNHHGFQKVANSECYIAPNVSN